MKILTMKMETVDFLHVNRKKEIHADQTIAINCGSMYISCLRTCSQITGLMSHGKEKSKQTNKHAKGRREDRRTIHVSSKYQRVTVQRKAEVCVESPEQAD